MQIDLDILTPKELLALNSRIMGELKRRNILRTNNKPIGDYAEWLVASTLNLQLANNSEASFDAIDIQGTRYQIKARTSFKINRNIQMSDIRHLSEQNFDFLIALFFSEDYSVLKCLSLPWHLVKELVRYNEYTNSYRLHIHPIKLADHAEVRDLTTQFSRE